MINRNRNNINEDDQDEQVDEQFQNHTIILTNDNSGEIRKASDLFQNKDWMNAVKNCFNSKDKLLIRVVNESLTKQADELIKILHIRFERHLRLRITNRSKHNHWSLLWSRKNITVIAAIMVLFDHVKRDLSCLDESTTLLSTHGNYLMIANVESNLQGAYLYYDMNDNKWIRSGKVTGRGFDVRHKEHQKKAKCHNHQSKFYSRYPSLESKLSKSCSRKGAFEGRVPFIACGFNPPDKNILTKDVDEGGVLFLSKLDKEKIRNVNFRGRTPDEKILDMIAYQFEIAYDLAICPMDNVSESAGFESCLGVFN